MALKSSYSAEEKGAEIEEALDALDKLVDRVKVLYEQYFMGIQKQAPSHLHNDAERRIRDVTQLQIRNTALRYRFATIQQKYGAYNTYWKRSLREIESGRYVRSLSKLRRQALASGDNIPPEILAAMPKRMRESVERDRVQALAEAQRRGQVSAASAAATAPPVEPDEVEADTEPKVMRIVAPPPPRRAARFTTDPFAGAGEGDIADALAGLADEALAAIEKPATRPSVPRVTIGGAGAGPGGTLPPRPATGGTLPPRPAIPTTRFHPPPPAPAPIAPAGSAPTLRPSVPGAPRATPPPPPAATIRSTPPPPTPAAPAPAPPRAVVPGMTEAETRALYAKYVKAREVVGDKSEGLSYDKLVRTLSNQAPKILEQHKATVVEFNVVIRDNKVVLKAKPR